MYSYFLLLRRLWYYFIYTIFKKAAHTYPSSLNHNVFIFFAITTTITTSPGSLKSQWVWSNRPRSVLTFMSNRLITFLSRYLSSVWGRNMLESDWIISHKGGKRRFDFWKAETIWTCVVVIRLRVSLFFSFFFYKNSLKKLLSRLDLCLFVFFII